MKLIDNIIAELGGELLAAHKLGLQEQSIKQWRRIGIPKKHWRKIARLTKNRVSLEKLLETLPK